MAKRFQVRRLTADMVDGCAELLAARHRRHRATCPALDPAYEDASRCASLIRERLGTDGSVGAVSLSDGRPAGFVLMTPRPSEMWGPNAWAEDDGDAGEGEAIREAYAAIAGELVDTARRGHWAMVPASDADLIEGWFSLSFGVQHAYAYREPIGADFELQVRDGLLIRRPTDADVPVLAELDLVLPNHLRQAPVFSTLVVPNREEVEADLANDIRDPKYSFWVAEHEGRVVATLVGTDLVNSSSWGPLMRPKSAALLGYAATLADARGLGAGRALTDTFMAWARDEGFEWLTTDWRSANIEANRTWRAMGFRPFFYRLFRAIP